jgi:hypothetical protein
MKTFNRLTTFAIGTSLALTPMLAFADTNATDQNTNTDTHAGFLSTIFRGTAEKNGVGSKTDENISASAEVDASSSEKNHSNRDGNKEGNNGLHLGQMKQGAHVEERADASIDGRINALEKISARLNSGTKLSADEKASFIAMIQTQIDSLTALKAKIGNDTSTSTMRDDAGKIRPEFRTYALVLPRTAVLAASDRLLTVAGNMETIGTKLNARIDAAAAASVNVTAARASYTDYVAKVADSKVQAQAAASLVANLSADNGDKTIFATNSAALKSAKAKLDASRSDLVAARKDMTDIVKAVKETEVTASTTSHTSL